jgi:hypothetical protein
MRAHLPHLAAKHTAQLSARVLQGHIARRADNVNNGFGLC